MGRYSSRSGRSSDEETDSWSSVQRQQSTDSSVSVQRTSDEGTTTADSAGMPASLGSLGSTAKRVQRLNEHADSSQSETASDSIGALDGAARLQRAKQQTDSSLGPKSTGGLGASERVQRLKETTGTGASRTASGPRLGTHSSRDTSGALQRSAEGGAQTGRAGETRVPEGVRDVISSPGRSLDTSIQRAVEDRMGDSLGDVRIHTGPKAAQACDEINARAFTVGNHVAFNAGEYDPSSPEGQHVLAHELAHVRQQTGGAVSMLPQENVGLEIDPNPQLEREAEETAQRVMEGEELGIQRLGQTEVHVQRLEESKVFDALAMFEGELEDGELSEVRERHNRNQIGHLHEIADEVIDKNDEQAKVDIKQEVQQSANPDAVAKELAQRWESMADLKSQVKDLKNSIDADLEDVALTEDQRRALRGNVETDGWDNVAWGTVKKILGGTTLPNLLFLATQGSKLASTDIDKRGVQTVAQARRGEITSLDDLQDIWKQTNGSLEDRAAQIEQEIREGTWLEENEDPYPGGGK
ncbi:eCIS core domain-containing protein [Natrinema ejinorense]